MSGTDVQVAFSFLASGPLFEIALPTDFDTIPVLSSPLLNGRGGRSFNFFPWKRDEGVNDSKLLQSVTDADGRPVDVYFRYEEPPIWQLRWSLGAGALYTHLREEDGVEMAEPTARAIAMVETKNGLPFLLPSGPLKYGASDRPGYQEEVQFFSDQRPDWNVSITRPGLLPAGSVLSASSLNSEGAAAFRAGTADNVDLYVGAGADFEGGRDFALALALSLRAV